MFPGGYYGSQGDGLLDEVRIWSVARTEAQIAANKDGELTGPQTGLVGYWPMNEGTGMMLHDVSGSGRDVDLTSAGYTSANWTNGRYSVATLAGGYRYGFNGQEHSTEIDADNDYTAQFWEYDARIARRWNRDPVVDPAESPYAVFKNNPIFNVDIDGSTPDYYQVQKGDNLSKIAKRYGTTAGSLAKINSIKDKDKIKVGQILIVGTLPSAEDSWMKLGTPENDFKNNPLTGYNNPNTKDFVYSLNATVGELAYEFAANDAEVLPPRFQNTMVVKGTLLKDIKKLPSVKYLIQNGIDYLNSDNKLTPGEYYKSNYYIGSLTGENGKRIIKQSFKDLFSTKKLKDNKFFEAENWLGSFGFSMRVTGKGTAVITVYDSKTMESATDRRSTLRSMVPELTSTYQRYKWTVNINKIKKEGTTIEEYE